LEIQAVLGRVLSTYKLCPAPEFRCDLAAASDPLPHFWEHTVGSCHATLALRADWQTQLARAHRELGFKHVRFHGILDDDMGTLICQSRQLLYSFFNADQVMDFLLSIGMRPFVELSFMPASLASAGNTVFHYRGNISLPRDLAAWETLIARLVGHWFERYGRDELRNWYFEVWNEPNLPAFFTGRAEDYFALYRAAARAIKSVDPQLRVGGPATAANAWLSEFLTFCERHGVPVDFVSTHHYPTDAFGRPGDDTEAQLAASPRSVLRQQARTARAQVGERPLYYTEWSTSSNARDTLHDDPYAASFIVKTVLEARGLVQGYSYWTFTDIFEENYFPSRPFHGGFGLLSLHGIAKPAYRAFELLHHVGVELIPVSGAHATVDCWVIRDQRSAAVLLTNYARPRQAIATETVDVSLVNCRAQSARIRRIDDAHANPKRLWLDMGSPEYLSQLQVRALHAASRCTAHRLHLEAGDDNIRSFRVTLPPLSVACVKLELLD
jgi:xylan 1,4-beta-xylosidase